ncbi:MAG: tRNA 2-thiouridine(34) synthase MnmA [Deltaproteobacteria bacterium]|nr:tRNA 2-thiouridine(34) synthase MnmA [Deltaproteobacteria bacterium]
MKPSIAVALSGGIDSLVAADFLQKQNHRIVGLHFITGYETDIDCNSGSVPSSAAGTESFDYFKTCALKKLAPIADQLDIEIDIVDCRKQFQSAVVDYFIRTYRNGKTPNPCLFCNPRIKFGTLLEAAIKRGASGLATGHYAIVNKDSTGRFHLYKGVDPFKEQSYFLAMLSQAQLAQACFPLGGMTKSDVVKLAGKRKLFPADRKESQDICFIKNNGYGAFLDSRPEFNPLPGLIEDIGGTVLGRHQGLHLFTIGQRRGINCPASEPYYVIRLDRQRNCLVVGWKKDLLTEDCHVENINWINKRPKKPIKTQVRLRYRHKEVSAKLYPMAGNCAKIRFAVSQEAVTPGQGAVFYENDEVLGGGWIK